MDCVLLADTVMPNVSGRVFMRFRNLGGMLALPRNSASFDE